jgi:hypothetical protein
MVRQGAIFSYIIVEIVWLCEFLCIAKVLRLTVSSGPLGSVVVERVLRRLDRWSNCPFNPSRVKLRLRQLWSVHLFAFGFHCLFEPFFFSLRSRPFYSRLPRDQIHHGILLPYVDRP